MAKSVTPKEVFIKRLHKAKTVDGFWTEASKALQRYPDSIEEIIAIAENVTSPLPGSRILTSSLQDLKARLSEMKGNTHEERELMVKEMFPQN